MKHQPEKITGAGRRALDRAFACGLACLFALSMTLPAYANPTGGTVSGGAATIATSGNTETITQSSGRAVIDWSTFNIGGGETTRFIQPSSSSLAVNRINDVNPSQILGTLSANGNIVLINPNGVFFAPGSTVNVNGLVATTSNVSNADVMAGGKLNFTPGGNPNAAVVNAGTITAAQAGLVGLVAPNVENSGVITATLGRVQMASGDSFTLDLYGDKLFEFGVSDAVSSQLVENSGVINAAGGKVQLTAAAGRQIVNSLIEVPGEIHTPAFAQKNGEITIYAAGSNAVHGNIAANKGQKQGTSEVLVSGWLDASGYGAGQTGGNISVLGDHVGILSGALIDASGDAGGGTIKIGGDFHGAGTTPTALNTYVDSNALILADAITSGNGGNVTVWSDGNTFFYGNISARGGSQSGNGGFVETSGRQTLTMQGMVDAGAPNGNAGTWLLDPNNLIINASATTNSGSGPNWTAGGGGGNVLNTDINTALNGGTSVDLTASGSIEVAASISKTAGSDATLTLAAGTDITIDSSVAISSTSGKLNTILDADTALGGGAITMNSGSSITSNGGNITMGGGEATPSNIVAGTGYAIGDAAYHSGITLNGASLLSNNGSISLNGEGFNGGVNVTLNGVFIEGGSVIESTTGAITINGIAGVGGCCNMGVWITGSGTLVSSAYGSINLTGNGNDGSNYGYGIFFDGQAVISSTGSGAGAATITLNGTGSSGSSGNNYGIIMDGEGGGNPSISSVDGAVELTGTGGGGANSIGIVSSTPIIATGSAPITIMGTASDGATGISMSGIGGSTDNGNITLIADSVDLTSVQTTGIVTLKPYTASTTIGVAGGAGTLQITSAILDDITAGGIIIGRSDGLGALAANAYSWAEPVTLLTGTGGIAINGAQTMGANSFTAQTAGASDITIGASGSVTSSATGNAITMITGNDFINSAGSSVFSTPAGHWLIYSKDPSDDTLDGLTGSFSRTGNEFLYSNPASTFTLPDTVVMVQQNPPAIYDGTSSVQTGLPAFARSGLDDWTRAAGEIPAGSIELSDGIYISPAVLQDIRPYFDTPEGTNIQPSAVN